MNFQIEPMQAADWESVRAIYIEGMATRNATFETAAPQWENWDATHLRFARLGKLDGVWRDVLMLERRSQVAGK